jgi:hypothetical protein
MIPLGFMRRGAVAAKEFRRAPDTQLWHWNEQCSKWPTRSFECRFDKPVGPHCEECKREEG